MRSFQFKVASTKEEIYHQSYNVSCKINKEIDLETFLFCYHPCMRIGNISVESVCLSVQALTFEPLKLRTSFRVSRYILTIFRSNLSTKVIGLRSIILNTRSCEGQMKKKLVSMIYVLRRWYALDTKVFLLLSDSVHFQSDD